MPSLPIGVGGMIIDASITSIHRAQCTSPLQSIDSLANTTLGDSLSNCQETIFWLWVGDVRCRSTVNRFESKTSMCIVAESRLARATSLSEPVFAHNTTVRISDVNVISVRSHNAPPPLHWSDWLYSTKRMTSLSLLFTLRETVTTQYQRRVLKSWQCENQRTHRVQT